MRKDLLSLGLIVALAAGYAQATVTSPPALSEKILRPVVEKYLSEKGRFCLGKFDWPIAVSAADREAATRDALQMPVLEHLGLVTATPSANDSTVTQYALSETGKKYYLAKQTVTWTPDDKPVVHTGDLCVAELQLDHVVKWLPLVPGDAAPHTTVKYTYRVASAASWAHDPTVQKVFPMIHVVVDGAGTLQMEVPLQWSGRTWVPSRVR